MDDHYFFLHLRDALTTGIEQYAKGIDDREAYLAANSHLFQGTLLTGCFAYVESNLGRGWIRNYGQAQQRELYVLRFVRNAFVHTDNDLTQLSPPWLGRTIDDTRGMPADITAFVQSYIDDLKNGTIQDDKGNPYPVYFDMNNGIVELKESAAHVITTICIKLFHRRENATASTSTTT